MVSGTVSVKLTSPKCQLGHIYGKPTLTEKSAVRQQAITNVDPDLCHHMASLGQNEQYEQATKYFVSTHGCIISATAYAALVLKYQTISSCSTYQKFILLDQFHTEILNL